MNAQSNTSVVMCYCLVNSPMYKYEILLFTVQTIMYVLSIQQDQSLLNDRRKQPTCITLVSKVVIVANTTS